MKFALFALSLILGVTAQAYVRTGSDSIKSPLVLIKKAKKEGVGISGTERALKLQILSQKKKNKNSLQENIQNGLANPSEYQSYLLEVRDGLDKIEKAKIIAKYTILQAIRKNKSFLQDSIMNRHAATTWAETEYYIKRDLNNSTNYLPIKGSKEFNFSSSDWGRITIASNLKTAKWHLDVASHVDANKPEDSAKDIKIDTEQMNTPLEMDSEETSMPPLSENEDIEEVPTLAKGAKKSEVIKSIRPKNR